MLLTHSSMTPSVKNWTPRADFCEMERQRIDTEDRLRTVERQKEDLEHHLLEAALKLQKTPVARLSDFSEG